MFTLSERTCVFAGASGGDGVASVRALLSQGMNVVIITHQMEQANKLKAELDSEGYPGRCGIYMDGHCYEPPKTDSQVMAEIYGEFGSVDVIIPNIGGPARKDSIDLLEKDELLGEIDHLVGGSFSMLKNALPYLRKSKAARVIFMTTPEGINGGVEGSLSNAVAKGAVYSLMKNCAARLMSEGITVNAISKGAIDRGLPKKDAEKFINPADSLEKIPAKRLGTDKDLAQAICYLASEETSYVTGTVIDLSGGLSLA